MSSIKALNSLRYLSKVFDEVADFLVPSRCFKCTLVIQDDQTLCPDCWKELSFIAEPLCICCGYPFEISMKSQSFCGSCHHRRPPYTMARSVLYYDDMSKSLILRFKHSDATHLAPLLGRWLFSISHEVLQTTDFLVPIPLHWRRLFSRRYNQAALLTIELARLSHHTMALDMLTRIRHTPFQGRLSSADRRRNVNNVFRVKPSWQNRIQNKTITLIDDVMTSGATINSCTKALLEAGVKDVNVLTLARVV